MKKNPPLVALQDYSGVLHSPRHRAFAKSIQEIFGGRIVENTGFVMYILHGVGAWKIYCLDPNASVPTGEHLPLRIEIPVSSVNEEMRTRVSSVSLEVEGADHWRVITMKLDGQVIGRVHVANRDAPIC